MVVGFVVLDFACGSSGLGLLMLSREFGLQLASKSATLSPGSPVGCLFVAVCF